jgi:hypothetical protein
VQISGANACIDTWVTDFRGDVAKIDVPTLIVHATADRILPYEMTAARLSGLIKGAKLVSIDGGPHNIAWTHADEVNAFDALIPRRRERGQSGLPGTTDASTTREPMAKTRAEAEPRFAQRHPDPRAVVPRSRRSCQCLRGLRSPRGGAWSGCGDPNGRVRAPHVRPPAAGGPAPVNEGTRFAPAVASALP